MDPILIESERNVYSAAVSSGHLQARCTTSKEGYLQLFLALPKKLSVIVIHESQKFLSLGAVAVAFAVWLQSPRCSFCRWKAGTTLNHDND